MLDMFYVILLSGFSLFHEYLLKCCYDDRDCSQRKYGNVQWKSMSDPTMCCLNISKINHEKKITEESLIQG